MQHHTAAPRLARHRIFASRNLDETEAFLHGKDFGFTVARGEEQALDAEINGIYLPQGRHADYSSYIGYTRYGAPMTLQAERQRDDYWMQFVTQGRLEVTTGGHVVVCDTARAAVASPTRHDYYLVRAAAGCVVVRVCFTKPALTAQLETLLGEPPPRPLEFAGEIDLTGGHGPGLRRQVQWAMADCEDSASSFHDPAVMRVFEQLLLTRMLLSQPNTYSAALRRADRVVSPRDVRRAVAFIEAHLAEPIAVSDIVRAAGVPGRTLFAHFRAIHGVPPMAYLRAARLRRAREALLRADPGESVTTIATGCGFDHLGRFAGTYRRQFGEAPSATLRRRG
ncbi:MAG: AraC family transcriptional regulator [Acetobacteraceae bacterium]|nr:AraC family transcriptional regulator [Acetobacteraceae bacterium]